MNFIKCVFFLMQKPKLKGEIFLILYLVRHGESEGNKKGVIQGHQNFALTQDGEKQAQLVGEFFSTKLVDVIYSSDLDRAFVTAESIGEHHPLDIIKWEQIREIGLGPLEGKKRQEIYLQYPEIKDIQSILTTGIEGTETITEITERCFTVLEQLLAAHKGKNVVLVSHGGFISIFLMYLNHLENWHKFHRPFVISNTGVTKIEFKDSKKPIFHYINRNNHLHTGSFSDTM